jgi:hypothetical protein
MSADNNKEGVIFNRMPPMCLDITADQALENYLEDYLPGGKNFELGTSDRVFEVQSREVTPGEVQP